MDLRKKVQPWTWEEGATVDLETKVATVDLGRRCHRGPKKKVPPWT